MGADDGEHISSDSSWEGLLGYSEVDKFDMFIFFIIEYILWFDISMADVFVMNIDDSLDELPYDLF